MKALVCPQIPDLGLLEYRDCNQQKQIIPYIIIQQMVTLPNMIMVHSFSLSVPNRAELLEAWLVLTVG